MKLLQPFAETLKARFDPEVYGTVYHRIRNKNRKLFLAF